MWINHKDWCSNKEYKIAQDSWVKHYKSRLEKLRPWDYSEWQRRPVAEQVIFEYYREGRIYRRLDLMDFNQFMVRVTASPYHYESKKWKRDEIRNHYKYNHNGKKNPKDYSKKKVLTELEQAKREWRKFKKDSRDQKHEKNYRGSVAAFKHDNKRSHRAFEKHCIDTGKFEKLHQRTWKEMANWWSYD